MNAVMLILAIFATSEIKAMSVEYPTLAMCEAERVVIIQKLAEPAGRGTVRPEYVALACLVPIKLTAA